MVAGGMVGRLLAAALFTLAAVGSAGATWFAAPAAAQTAPKRIALVIGNGAYKQGALKNPVNDARAMVATLRQLGFQVIQRENATKQQMEQAVGEFGRALGKGSVALFYYAGHGMQVNGRNFLIPTDAVVASEQAVRLETLDVDLVLDQVAAAGSDVNLVVLDACRNNPFERRFRSAAGGLAQINAPKGTLIAYATAPGSVAADGTGANGLYTAKLVEAIKTPGLPIEEVFKRVRVEVSRESNDAQTPWEASSLVGNFYFLGPTTVIVNQPAQTQPAPAQSAPQVAAAPAPVPAASAARFDGTWDGKFFCPAHSDGTKEYGFNFIAEIRNGVLRASHSSASNDFTFQLDGPIDPDGSAMLEARGTTGRPDTTLRQLKAGSPYKYDVATRFDDKRGKGDRTTGRTCTMFFTKR